MNNYNNPFRKKALEILCDGKQGIKIVGESGGWSVLVDENSIFRDDYEEQELEQKRFEFAYNAHEAALKVIMGTLLNAVN
ncbi:hypothetical protein [uncultured Mediterranean phage uvMED]|nr:hypothetical protein [uncultured Mediterranean phage uvMED]BAR22601.1 hypothetical protein [uncultured Mediterranean phage uvMED]